MRIGLVCPYSWDVPGGVQAHVRDLAEALLSLGHTVSVIAPADDDSELPSYVVSAGRAVPVPYNGSVARLAFGPLSAARVRRWVREGRFDVLHVHEPTAPSLSLLACLAASGPIVATFHTSTARSRMLSAAGPALQPALEKIRGRIAVSPAARRTLTAHLGGDAVLLPNGVDVARFAGAEPLPGWPEPGQTVGFLGRIDEPRKGLSVLLAAFGRLAVGRPDLRLLVAGRGDVEEARDSLPAPVRDRVRFLGLVSEADKPRFYRSVDVFCAPNLGGESFGIVLLEAMAAGTPIVASGLEAFRRVLAHGRAGVLVPVNDPPALAAGLDELLTDAQRRRQLAAAGVEIARQHDWHTVAAQVLHVYDTVGSGTATGVGVSEDPSYPQTTTSPRPMAGEGSSGQPEADQSFGWRGWRVVRQ